MSQKLDLLPNLKNAEINETIFLLNVYVSNKILFIICLLFIESNCENDRREKD